MSNCQAHLSCLCDWFWKTCPRPKLFSAQCSLGIMTYSGLFNYSKQNELGTFVLNVLSAGMMWASKFRLSSCHHGVNHLEAEGDTDQTK